MKEKIESKLTSLKLRYKPDDIEKLFSNIVLLNKYNLIKLTERLLEQNKASKFIETLTEINFTSQLLKSLPSSLSNLEIFYESKENKRPIDLVIEYSNKKYSIQIKCLSSSIRDNKQSKIYDAIKNQSINIKANRAVSLSISKNFTIDHVNKLMKFISVNLNRNDNEMFPFLLESKVFAQITFLTPKNKIGEHLGIYSFGDIDAVEITGMTKEQVKNSLLNAAGAFEKDSAGNIINLIVSEIRNDQRDAVDFAEALYGTEYSISCNGKMQMHRDNDGLFMQENFANKISGIVVLHRKTSSLMSAYEKIICTNPFGDYLKSITELIHGRVIERFTWIGSGFFNH